MQRMIGAVLVVASTGGAGFLYGAWLKEYVETLLYLRHVIYLLKGELEYSGAPLQEVFGRTAAHVKEPYRRWLKVMERRVAQRNGETFQKIWLHSIDNTLTELHLKKIHIRQLKELGDCLGQMDHASENREFALYLERLELEIEKERTQIAVKGRIGNCLGVLGGMFLVILLL